MANSELSFHSSADEEGVIQRCSCTSVKQSRSRLQAQQQKSASGLSSLLESTSKQEDPSDTQIHKS